MDRKTTCDKPIVPVNTFDTFHQVIHFLIVLQNFKNTQQSAQLCSDRGKHFINFVQRQQGSI